MLFNHDAVVCLGGAALVFTFTLYPYVYLLVRTALGGFLSKNAY